MPLPLTPEDAAKLVLQRKAARTQFAAWCEVCGYQLARHHKLIVEEIQKAVELYKKGQATNLMLLMPPGSAKSTYTSKLFPPWFLAQQDNLAILACSHSAELANDFGRAGRNIVDTYQKVLGVALTKDSRAADSWELSNGGYYRAAGCGAGIAGRRADLGLIDDFAGTEEDACSKTFNDKIWSWYLNDFVPRLKPNAVRVLICNHRNEDDLAGRLLAREGSKWRTIRLRLLIETQAQADEDPLGRSLGEHLWPEYFTKELVTERMSNPSASGIEQQEPSPEKGDFFQADWFQQYDTLPPKDELQFYCASDHAVSEKQTADLTCCLPAAYGRGKLWILPDPLWDKLGSKAVVEGMLALIKKYRPLYWWAEKGHISKSIGPFLQDRMMDEKVFGNIVQVTPVKDKMSRAQAFNAMMAMGTVMWPKTSWFQRAKREFLMFPNGKHDDFVDAASWLGMGVHRMIQPSKKIEVVSEAPVGFNITPRSLKEAEKREKRSKQLCFIDR